jgi:hypothetical protein
MGVIFHKHSETTVNYELFVVDPTSPGGSVVLGLPGQGFEVRQLTSEDEEVLMLGEPRAAVSCRKVGSVVKQSPKKRGSIGL